MHYLLVHERSRWRVRALLEVRRLDEELRRVRNRVLVCGAVDALQCRRVLRQIYLQEQLLVRMHFGIENKKIIINNPDKHYSSRLNHQKFHEVVEFDAALVHLQLREDLLELAENNDICGPTSR